MYEVGCVKGRQVGLHQGSDLSPLLFAVVMDRRGQAGLSVDTLKVTKFVSAVKLDILTWESMEWVFELMQLL